MPTTLPLAALLPFVLASMLQPHEQQNVAPPRDTTVAREIFPHVRLDRARGRIEIDAAVPIDAHQNERTRVYLETVACSWDSKEHESLVVTRARPSHVHAALLLLGAQPGTPGVWNLRDTQWVGTPATGDPIRVTLRAGTDPAAPEQDPAEWIINVKDSRTLRQTNPDAAWRFAGSRLIPASRGPSAPGSAIADDPSAAPKPTETNEPNTSDRRAKPAPATQPAEVYAADIDGTLIGLTTFSTETLGLSVMYNPDSDKSAPEWIANRARIPRVNTPVTIILSLEPTPQPTPKPTPATTP